jgi:hypothetical protein
VKATYEQLYSAAARMLVAQGAPSWRDDRWPDRRKLSFRELEAFLAADDGGRPVDGDPARQLLSIKLGFAAADRSLREYLRGDPEGVDQPLVVPGPLHSQLTSCVDELAARLAPGRPSVALSNEAAELGQVVHELANLIRAGLGLEPGSVVLTSGSGSTGPAATAGQERLAALTRAAADTIPAPEELGTDFSVRQATAVAAADVRAVVAGADAPVWRERQPGIDPARHVLTAYRWNGDEGRPVTFAERAAELRASIEASESPWRPTVERPLPEPAPDLSWVLYSSRQGLITADLLDELAVRLSLITPVGPIHFSAYSLHDFLTTTLNAGTTEL